MENKKLLKEIEFFIKDDKTGEEGQLPLVSIVKDPAINKNFQFFSKENSFKIAFANEEKQLIIGPAMIPNKRILRKNPDTGEYFNCYFSENTIRQCQEYFMEKGNTRTTNLDHGQIMTENQMEDCFVSQTWIVNDENMDTARSYGLNPIKGEWYIAFKVKNPSLWAALKEGGYAGFSIEGIFLEKFSHLFEKSSTPDEIIAKKIKDILEDNKLSDTHKGMLIKNIVETA